MERLNRSLLVLLRHHQHLNNNNHRSRVQRIFSLPHGSSSKGRALSLTGGGGLVHWRVLKGLHGRMGGTARPEEHGRLSQ